MGLTARTCWEWERASPCIPKLGGGGGGGLSVRLPAHASPNMSYKYTSAPP